MHLKVDAICVRTPLSVGLCLLVRVQAPGNTQKTHWGAGGGKTHWKPNKKPTQNLIEFHFVMPVIIEDCFMFTAFYGQ